MIFDGVALNAILFGRVCLPMSSNNKVTNESSRKRIPGNPNTFDLNQVHQSPFFALNSSQNGSALRTSTMTGKTPGACSTVQIIGQLFLKLLFQRQFLFDVFNDFFVQWRGLYHVVVVPKSLVIGKILILQSYLLVFSVVPMRCSDCSRKGLHAVG